MISVKEFNRVAGMAGLTADQARGTVFYSRIKSGTMTVKKLQNKPLYQTMPLLEQLFRQAGLAKDFLTFLDWSNEPFAVQDRLKDPVQKFLKYYDVVECRRYLLKTSEAIELYSHWYLNQDDDNQPRKPSLLDSF